MNYLEFLFNAILLAMRLLCTLFLCSSCYHTFALSCFFFAKQPLILLVATDDRSGFTDKKISAASEQRKYTSTLPETNRLFVHVKILPCLSGANCEFPATR